MASLAAIRLQIRCNIEWTTSSRKARIRSRFPKAFIPNLGNEDKKDAGSKKRKQNLQTLNKRKQAFLVNMALIDEQSCICVNIVLDLLDLPLTQTSIEQGPMVDYHPIASTLDVDSIKFCIPGIGDDYLDPPFIYLQLSVK